MAKSEFAFLNRSSSTLKENRDDNIKEGEFSGTQNEKVESRGGGKRGRKPAKLDMKMKLERSQQSARECRARKKLRYQYLEELVTSREKAIQVLKKELEMYKGFCKSIDEGRVPKEVLEMAKSENEHKA